MLLADSYLHALNPFAIEFSQGFGIRWYGLAYAFAFLVGWLTARYVAGRTWSLLPLNRVGDFIFAAILGVLLGGRLGYALFYDQRLFIGFSSSLPYWDLLAINRGGMASHGGMIGVIIATFWWAHRNRVDAMHLMDIGAIAATIGLGVGRIANFVNAELWGKPLPNHQQSFTATGGITGADPPWWSIKYPQEIELWTKTLDSRLDLIEPLRSLVGGGEVFYERLIAKLQNGDAAIVPVVKPLLTAYYPSQIFQAVTDGPILFTLLALVWLKPRKPGVIVGWFLIGYGVLRIATEMYRQPDEGVSLTFGLFSRGQLLSALMVAGGVVCLWFMARRTAPRIGGLFAK